MSKNNLIETLTDLGLDEKEARVYMASLSLGPATVLAIAKSAGVKRTTVYSVVESLKKKGLVIIEVRGFKKFYTPQPPSRLEVLLAEKRKVLQNSMPKLLELYGLEGSSTGSIKHYEGLEAVKSVYAKLISTVKPKEDYLVIANSEDWYRADPKYFEKFSRDRAKLPIKLRMLLQDSPIARKMKGLEKFYNGKVKILPANTKFASNVVIIPEMVVIHQLVPPIMAIVIENPIISKSFKEMFDIMWDSI